MRNRQIESTFKNIFLLLFFAVTLFSCNKKAIENGVRPGKKVEFKNQRYYKNAKVDNELYFILHSPEWDLDIFSFGKKNQNGDLIKLTKQLFFNPVDSSWCYYEIKDKYPSNIRTSKDITTELTNYNRTALTVDVLIKDAKGVVILNKIGQKLEEDFFVGFENSAKYISQNNLRKGFEIKKSDCQEAKDAAELLGFAANAFSCGIGLLTIAESAGIALIFDVLGFLTSCYSVLSTVVNKLEKAVNPDSKNPPLPGLNCAENAVNDGIGALGMLASTTPTKAISVAVAAAAGIGDAAGCVECPPENKPKKPSSSGDPHITTLDGFYFTFQGHGEFVAVKSITDNFEIQARQEAWIGSKTGTVNTGIAIKTSTNEIISVTVDPLKIYINKKLQASGFGSVTLTDGSIFSETDKRTYRLDTKQGDIIIIETEFNFLDYTIDLASSRASKVKGLFGNFDGNTENDLSINGKVITDVFSNKYPAYSDSWRITQNNSLFVYEDGKNTATYTIKTFPENEVQFTENQIIEATKTCKNAGVTSQPYLNNCVFDVAVTGNAGFAKSALGAQNLIFIGNIPSGNISGDINYFPKVRLEINPNSQSDISQLNLISWGTGKVFALKDGAANATKVDGAVISFGGGSYFTFYPMSTLKACDNSCDVGNINEVIDSQEWSTSRKGSVEFKFGIDKENSNDPNFVSSSKWPSLIKASDIQNIHKLINLDIDDSSNFATLVESQNSDLPNTPYSNTLYRFITQEGKKGVFVISGFGKIEGTAKYFITLDVKIEK